MKTSRIALGAFTILLAVMLHARPADALQGGTPADRGVCIAAAQEAARRTGVPFEVLLAISLTETGTKRDGHFDVWPWTVNMEGKGVWFDSRDEALAFALQNRARGARSFDIGCFQLNFRWHGQGFASIDEMFDPLKGALYAADFLSGLYAETGSWSKAAGLYHSRTPEHATRYSALFEKHLITARKRIVGGDMAQAVLKTARIEQVTEAGAQVKRPNDYPLLQRGHSGQLGSLVPLALLVPRAGQVNPRAVTQDSLNADL